MNPIKGIMSCAIVLCVAFGTSSVLQAQEYSIRFAHSLSTNEPFHEAAEWFAEQMRERTDGRVEITVFPGEQLGVIKDVLELVRQGANVISIADSGYLADFVPDFGVLQGPYLLTDPAQYGKILASDWYTGLHSAARSAGYQLLGSNWFFGERHVIADRPIRTLADFDGVSIRVPPVAMFIETFRALGARPVTLEWSEVYSGLSQGVVNGAEAPLPTIYGSRLHETRDHISMTQHFTGYLHIAMSRSYFDSLPEDIQNALMEVGHAAGEHMAELTLLRQKEIVDQFRAAGVSIVEDVDIEAMAEATAAVYEEFPQWTPGLHGTIQAIVAE